MTTAADDSASEEAFEAYLAGKPVPEPGATLAAFAGAVRATATQPGRPNAALAELLATGLLVDQPPLSARTAKRRRRRMWFISVIFAKIASAGAIAQAATGAGIVLVGFTGVGAAGALPTPVQHGFATVVAAITPLSPSDGSADVQPATESSDSTAPSSTAASSSADATVAASTETASTETASSDTAGTDSAASATSTPKNHGELISSLAHERNDERKASHNAGSDDSRDSEATATSARSTESGGSDGKSSGHGTEHASGGGSSHGGSGKSEH